MKAIKKILQQYRNQNDFSGAVGNRSESDVGSYLASVHNALSGYRQFSNFKQDLRYQQILEHTSKEQADQYLKIIERESPDLIACIDSFKINDLVGGATTYEFRGIGSMSPSTLRYLKVASDLKKYFGESIGERIAEIGVGYGGQLLIADRVFKFKQYDLFDLPPVLLLASRYIECHNLNASYLTTTLNQHCGDVEYDLVISNYAFSELPSKLQMHYIKKILVKSKCGFLTMNSGKNNSVFVEDKLSLGELKDLLPQFEIIPELPLTHPENFILIWGR